MYKQSKYNIIVPHGDIFILYNTATSAILELNQEYHTKFSSSNWQKFTQEEIKMLHEQGFLKFYDHDEDFYQSLLRNSAISKNMGGITALTILPTTECNARCAYCYQSGIKKESMQEETVDTLIAFIQKYISSEKKLSISWFGGEPLLEHDKITRICKALEKENIIIKSNMISNGSLFTEELIQNAKSIWHLNKVQITIDGLEEDYNLIKNYTNIDNAFHKVINVIKLLLNNNINVSVRVNFEYENVNKAFTSLEWLQESFGGNKGFHLYAHPIYDKIDKYVCDNPEEHILYKMYLKDINCGKCNFNDLMKPKEIFCGAMIYNSFYVSPNGKLYLCYNTESLKPGEDVGNIWTGPVLNQAYKKWSSAQLDYEECKNCVLLPCCQGGCKATYLYEGRTPCVLYKPFYKELIKLIYEKSIEECHP